MDFDQKILAEVRRVANSAAGDARDINTHLLGIMVWQRMRLLEQIYLQQTGGQAVVNQGAFQGMLMQLPVHAGAALPMLLGAYESELHPFIEQAVARGYRHVINIGCGDGYYPVGMARRMPQTQFFGYDINPKAQESCRRNADINQVGDRVTVHGEFRGEDFAAHPDRQTLIICDIEGGEDALLDPARYSALKGHDIVVELHEVIIPGISNRLRERFADTHDIAFVTHQAKRITLPPGMQNAVTELDELLCIYEGRDGPTPWFVMTARQDT